MLDILVIGAGTAGLTAGIYGSRAGNSVLILEKNVYGGQIINTPDVENFPAIPYISGFDYSVALYNQATDLGSNVEFCEMTSFDFSSDTKKIVKIGDRVVESKTIIIANGVKSRLLDCEGEDKFMGKGVSYCATCDGAFFKNQDVVIVGGGNTALEDALFLSNNCKTVYLVHRRDEFRADKTNVDAVLKRDNIKIIYNTVVESVHGEEKVSHITLKDIISSEKTSLDCRGVFVAVGKIPTNDIFKDVINLDEYGYIIAGEDCKTNVKGVFVAGDTRTKNVRQLITAAADGAVAALEASSYINKNFN